MAQTDVTKNTKAVLTALNGLDLEDAERALHVAHENLRSFATINYANAADLVFTDDADADSSAATDSSTAATSTATTTA